VAIVACLFTLGVEAAFVVVLLGILEITFSFENAVINARVLSRLSPAWQTAFLSVGIIIAVFGMRLVFPILLVTATSNVGFGQVIHMVLNEPAAYSQHLQAAAPLIAAFGGSFLLMVAFRYFLHENQAPFWLPRIEVWLRRLTGSLAMTGLIVAAISIVVLGLLASGDITREAIAVVLGVAIYTGLHMISTALDKFGAEPSVGAQTGSAALVTFLYLEVLDASFSLDGVIGAFAITSSVLLIAIGLGIGAIWVRSLTIGLVRHQTLARYAHLEQGAHYAIAALALVLLLSVKVHVPEVVTGLMGVVIVGLSLLQSRTRSRAAS